MKVSIITVCFNSDETIRTTIESVLSQTYDDIEYIIIDGKSTDSTMDIVTEYKNSINVMMSEPDAGIYDAMNKGIAISTGEVVGILNSDDFYASQTVIEEVVDRFKRMPACDLVFGDVAFVDSRKVDKILRLYRSNRFRPWKLRFGWMPPHPATFIKKKTYKSIGEYSLDYIISSDYEMFVRLLLLHKCDFSRINGVLVKMRMGGISTSGLKNSLLLNREIVRACRSNGIYTNLFFVLIKFPVKIFELLRCRWM